MEGGEIVPQGQKIYSFNGGGGVRATPTGKSHLQGTWSAGRNWGVEIQVEDLKWKGRRCSEIGCPGFRLARAEGGREQSSATGAGVITFVVCMCVLLNYEHLEDRIKG